MFFILANIPAFTFVVQLVLFRSKSEEVKTTLIRVLIALVLFGVLFSILGVVYSTINIGRLLFALACLISIGLSSAILYNSLFISTVEGTDELY